LESFAHSTFNIRSGHQTRLCDDEVSRVGIGWDRSE
jgi:hypothetical protein